MRRSERIRRSCQEIVWELHTWRRRGAGLTTATVYALALKQLSQTLVDCGLLSAADRDSLMQALREYPVSPCCTRYAWGGDSDLFANYATVDQQLPEEVVSCSDDCHCQTPDKQSEPKEVQT